MSAFERIPPGEQFPVSATLYVTYLRCPQQALSRLAGIYPPTTKVMFRGSLAHRIFARHLVDGPITAERFARVCREETGVHLGGSMASLSLKWSEFTTITAEVEELYERFKALPTGGFVGAEVDITAEPVDGVTLRGRIDAVFSDEGAVRLVDWKTGADLDDAEAQLAFYAMTWRIAKGCVPRAVEAMSLKTGERHVAEPTVDDIVSTECAVADMIASLRSATALRTELPRSAGPHCRWCPLLSNCQEGRAALAILG